jgi:hypothetical protein
MRPLCNVKWSLNYFLKMLRAVSQSLELLPDVDKGRGRAPTMLLVTEVTNGGFCRRQLKQLQSSSGFAQWREIPKPRRCSESSSSPYYYYYYYYCWTDYAKPVPVSHFHPFHRVHKQVCVLRDGRNSGNCPLLGNGSVPTYSSNV